MKKCTHVKVASVAAVLILAGCGSNAAPAAETTSPSPAASPAASPSPTEMTATAEQYASVVNPALTDLATTWEKYEDSCLLDEDSLCEIIAMTVDLRAQAVVLVLTGSAEPGVPGYIGAPPAEVAKLVDETVAAAQALDDTITDDGEVKDGVGAAGDWAVNFVDRWEPYV